MNFFLAFLIIIIFHMFYVIQINWQCCVEDALIFAKYLSQQTIYRNPTQFFYLFVIVKFLFLFNSLLISEFTIKFIYGRLSLKGDEVNDTLVK